MDIEWRQDMLVQGLAYGALTSIHVCVVTAKLY